MDLDALILANGRDYLLRRLVDRAVCSKVRRRRDQRHDGREGGGRILVSNHNASRGE
jgi:hypothetical protein